MMSTQGFRMSTVAAAFAVAAASFGISAGAGAQGWHGGGGGGGGGVMAIMRQLDLTSQQKEQIHALMQANRQATESTREQLQTVTQQLETTMFSTSSVSSSDVTPLLQQQEQLRATLDQARLTTALGVRGILTATQLQQASTLHAQLASLHAQEHALIAPPSSTTSSP